MSNINENVPAGPTASVTALRNNFVTAKGEIEEVERGATGAGVIMMPPNGALGPTGPHAQGTLWVNENTLGVWVWFGGPGDTAGTTGAAGNWRGAL
jgi:hypothetical protein